LNNRIVEFDPWGQFIKTWGWDVNASNPAFGLEVCAAVSGDTCKAGTRGGRGGQLNIPHGIANDSGGNVYAVDIEDLRIEKYSPAGQFLLAWGGDVVFTGPDDTGANEQQAVSIPNSVTAGTYTLTLVSARGFGTFAASSKQVEVGTTAGEFKVGDEISGSGLESGTLVTAIEGSNLIVSKDTKSASTEIFLTARETTEPIEYNASAGELEERLEDLAAIGSGNITVSGGPGASGTPFTVTFSGGPFAHDDISLLFANSSLTGGFASVEPVVEGGSPELCTAADVCKAGTLGAANGEFGAWAQGSFVAVGPGDKVYVGDVGRIQIFNTVGEYQSTLPDPEGLLSGKKVSSLAADPLGGLFVALASTANVLKLDSATGKRLCTANVAAPQAVAADPVGKLYVADKPLSFENQMIRKFGSDCAEIEDGEFPFSQGEGPTESFGATGIAADFVDKKGGVHVYLSNALLPHFLGAYGSAVPDPDVVGTQPLHPPEIKSQFATSVDTDGATLRAQINPHFWPDTTYYVQYGTGACVDESGWGAECVEEKPASPLQLGGGVIDANLVTAAIFVGGLEADTAYKYRFVAQSSGGGPVFGVDPDGDGPEEAGFETGLAGTFTTFAPPLSSPACANGSLRGGASSHLPDCRAYEMVSPLDKNGGDIRALTKNGQYVSFKQSSLTGGKITYSAATAFGDAPAGPYSSQYISSRSKDGWSTHGISPPRGTAIFEGNPQTLPAYEINAMFEAFTLDLSSAWLRDSNATPLTEDGMAGYVNLYRRDNTADTFEALTNEGPVGLSTEYLNDRAEPTAVGDGPGLRFDGYSTDASHSVFTAGAALTPDAAPVKPECHFSASGAETTFLYQWLRNGIPIGPPSADPAYTITPADEGKVIQCQASVANLTTGSMQIAAGVVWIAAPRLAVPPPLPPSSGIAAPVSSSVLTVGGPGGQTLTCDPDAAEWARNPEGFTYRWFRNGSEIAGATASTYLVTAENVKKAATFQCVVTASNLGGAFAAASKTTVTSPAPEAPEGSVSMTGGKTQLYDLHEGQLKVVSVLPGGEANPDNSYAGTRGSVGETRESSVEHAVSDSGSRIFWTTQSKSPAVGPGMIYARINPAEPQSALALGSAAGVGDLTGPATGSGKTSNGSTTVNEVQTNSGGFAVGQSISGGGIPAETTITTIEKLKNGNLKLKISKAATATLPSAALSGAASKTVLNATAGSGAFAAGQSVVGIGIPFGTTITEVAGAALTLSVAATKTGTGVGLESFSACTEPEAACTLPVSEEAEALSKTDASRFWTAAADGSAALFTSGEDLYRFDTSKAIAGDPGATTLIAHKAVGVLGAADDLSYAYFVSKEVLSEGAVAGQFNLYADHEGVLDLVVVLGSADIINLAAQISPVSVLPILRASRVTPDGRRIAFQAVSSLTGYDNLEPLSGKRYTEVYRYDAAANGGEGELSCVSCDPTGGAPSGLPLIATPYTLPNAPKPINFDFGTSGVLPTWERETYASRLLSDDGSRLFFESYESLVPRDTNGVRDVYQWELAQGATAKEEKASCQSEGAELYVPASGGCLSLISTGASPQPSEFIDASASGDDVFIATTSSIARRDEGLIDIYDARVGGGFPEPVPPVTCVGDACKPVPSPPSDPTPASAAFKGPGNPRLRCPKGKHKNKKARCVPNKKKHKKKKAKQSHNRRAAR
jgi:hypothetical protein